MRWISAVAIFLVAGCSKPAIGKGSPASVLPPPVDPVAAHHDAEEQAAYSIDAACASIETALTDTKKLAPVAGGEAKEALLNVAEMLDSAGATLADHDDQPPALPQYRKLDADRAAVRQKAVSDAIDALQELRDASGVLEDLSQNVPPEHAPALEKIQASTDDAIEGLKSAISDLGGKVPA